MPVKDVVDPSKVKCTGPGLGAGVRARVPQTFTVDCSKAGRAPLEVVVLGPSGRCCLWRVGLDLGGSLLPPLLPCPTPRAGGAGGGAR